MEKVLTKEAQADRDEFIDSYSYRGGCSCHISQPCHHCVHPGNPLNQDDCDECWEDDLGLLRSGEIRRVCAKRARVLRRRGDPVWWSSQLNCLVWAGSVATNVR